MSDQTVPVTAHDAPTRPRVRAQADLLTTVRNLWPYIWPSERTDLKRRIYMALAMLIVAKLITIAVPYAFK